MSRNICLQLGCFLATSTLASCSDQSDFRQLSGNMARLDSSSLNGGAEKQKAKKAGDGSSSQTDDSDVELPSVEVAGVNLVPNCFNTNDYSQKNRGQSKKIALEIICSVTVSAPSSIKIFEAQLEAVDESGQSHFIHEQRKEVRVRPTSKSFDLMFMSREPADASMAQRISNMKLSAKKIVLNEQEVENIVSPVKVKALVQEPQNCPEPAKLTWNKLTLHWHPQGQNQSMDPPVEALPVVLPAITAVAPVVPAVAPAILAAAPGVPSTKPANPVSAPVFPAPKPAAKPAVISEQAALTQPQSGAPQTSKGGSGGSGSQGNGGNGGSSGSQGKGRNTKGWFSRVAQAAVTLASNTFGHKSHRRALASAPVMQMSTKIPANIIAELSNKPLCGARFSGPLKMIEATDKDESSGINNVFKGQFMFDLNGTLLAATNTWTTMGLSERPLVLRLSDEMFAQSNAVALTSHSKNADTQYCLGTDATCFQSPTSNAPATQDSALLKAMLINQNYLRSLMDESVRAGLPIEFNLFVFDPSYLKKPQGFSVEVELAY